MRGATVTGVGVDTTEMYTAAILVRRAAEDGESEDTCSLWSFDYGHDGLASAAQTFLADSDRALDRLRDAGSAIADSLTTQAGAYQATDAAAADRARSLAERAPLSGPALGMRKS